MELTASEKENRFGSFIERRDRRDFPFYNGTPSRLTTWQWIGAWISVTIGFLALVLIPQSSNIQTLVPRVLFLLIPLFTFIFLAKTTWTALFRKPTFADCPTVLGFFVLNMALSVGVAVVVKSLFGANPNPAADGLAHAHVLEIGAFYVGTGIQIMGEELFTIIPFLATMHFLVTTGRATRRKAILGASLLSTLWFAAAHLPTYDWNVAQAFLIIGTARIVLTLAYIRTKNLWVCFGAHVLTDWFIFTLDILL